MAPERRDGPVYDAQPELAIAAVMAMLGRYPFVRCARMAASIVDHLRYIAFDERYSPAVRDTAGRLLHEWQFLHGARSGAGDEADASLH